MPHLADDLGGGQVAVEALIAGTAKAALECAARLAGDTQGAAVAAGAAALGRYGIGVRDVVVLVRVICCAILPRCATRSARRRVALGNEHGLDGIGGVDA